MKKPTSSFDGREWLRLVRASPIHDARCGYVIWHHAAKLLGFSSANLSWVNYSGAVYRWHADRLRRTSVGQEWRGTEGEHEKNNTNRTKYQLLHDSISP